MIRLLVGGYSGDKGSGSGITVLEDGEAVATIPAESPSWIAWHPDLPVLYAVAEVDDGQVHAWRLQAEPRTAEPLGCGQTGGSEPAHLTVDRTGKFLITANYTGGSISVHRLGPDGSIGKRTDLVQHEQHGETPRQEAAHPHMVEPFEDGVLVIDLGGDAIYQYSLSDAGKLKLIRIVDAPPGSGPRHLLQVGERYYVTAELSGELLVFEADGKLAGRQPASRSAGHNQPSELASDGRFLYVANRGPNTITTFALDSNVPRYLDEVSVGDWPRHIALDGGRLYVANERSNDVMALLIDPDSGLPALERAVAVPSPTVVLL
jgi:6-phosphogluconolactonase